MDKKRFSMGVLDLYSLAISETAIESTPAIKVSLKDKVDVDRLSVALGEALEYFPVFATTLEYSDGEYWLVEHSAKPPVMKLEDKLPRFFGRDTGGYLFRIVAAENSVTLEWFRAVTDSFHAVEFLSAILSAYFGEAISVPYESGMGVFLESLSENKEPKASSSPKPAGENDEEKKESEERHDYSKIKSAKIKCKNINVARVHTLAVKTSDLSSIAKRTDVLPEAIIIPIFACVLANRAGKDANITADIQVDARKSLGAISAHNFTVAKTLLYKSSYGAIEPQKLIESYDKMISSAREADSVKKEAERTVSSMQTLVSIRPRVLLDFASLMTSRAILGQRSNFSVQSIGEVVLKDAVMANVESIFVRDPSPLADTGISLATLGDTTYITLRENYADEKIAADFIKTLMRLGANIKVLGSAEISEPKLKM